ncbi:MAG: hypothetical protein JXA21_25200 [Anaerolineae bacterium]|nr:hypothetical protein [Anaerolineae bacterium]
MKSKFLPRRLLLVLVAGLLCACNTPTPPLGTSVVPPAKPITTATPTATKEIATEEPAATGEPAATEVSSTTPESASSTAQPAADAFPGWERYDNQDYGFSLSYPKAWKLTEDTNALYLTRELPDQTLQLRVAYRFLSEDVDLWGRTGIQAGELEMRGVVRVLRHTLLKKVLVYEEKDKAVFYNSAQEIESGELAFLFVLETSQGEYANVDITTEVQDEVDKILSSLVQASLKGDGWLTYVNADYGFSFRYPEAWLLLQDANFIRLSKDMTILNIHYRHNSETIADWGKTGLPAGDFETRGKSVFLGQALPRETVVFESKDKAVFYNGVGAEVRAGELAFWLSLQDMNSDYLAANLSTEMLSEVDRILGSFLLEGPAIWASSTLDTTRAGWLKYSDKTYGFSLSFPERWDGYRTTISDTAKPATVAFWFESLKPANSLVVQVYSPEEWDNVKNRMVYLGETDKHVFAIAPYDPECTKMQAFQCERHKEIPSILETFEALPIAAATPSAGTCTAGQLWLDAWPTNASCNAGGWSISIFAEGHGGNCSYTYYWNGEKIQGPVNGSIGFDVSAVGKSTIMGEVMVKSGDQTATAPVYAETQCP